MVWEINDANLGGLSDVLKQTLNPDAAQVSRALCPQDSFRILYSAQSGRGPLERVRAAERLQSTSVNVY